MQRYLQREFGTTSGYQSSAEYILTCVISDMPNRGSNYFLLDYQIVQLVPDATTGPDSGAGVIVWEKAYEVKYQW